MDVNTVSQNFAAFNAAGTILTNGLGDGFDCNEDFTLGSVAGATLTNGLSGGVSNSYTVNTSAGSPLCTCFSATGIGTVNNCPVHGTSTIVNPGITFIPTTTPTFPSTSPNWTITWPSPEVECYICQDKLQMDDMAAGKKVCKDCRRAVEAFKAVLVCEDEEKE